MLTVLLAALQLGGLAADRPVTRTITSERPSSVQIRVTAPGQFISGVVEQGDTDVALGITAPDGRSIAVVNTRQRGAEIVAFVADIPGTYRLEIRAVDAIARPRTIRVRINEGRVRTELDDSLVSAVLAATDARQLAKKSDRDSLRRAIELRESALPFWRDAGDTAMVFSMWSGIGESKYRLSEYAAAKDAFEAARPLAARLGDRNAEAETANNLGLAHWRLGDIAEARVLLQQAVDGWQATRSANEAIALSNLGIILRQSGDYDQARLRYLRALAIHQSTGNRRSQAFALNNLAFVLDDMGKRKEALEHLARAIALFREFRDQRAEARALSARGQIQLALGRTGAALTATTRAHALILEAGDRRAEAETLVHLGRIRQAAGDGTAARAEFSKALAIARDIRSPRGESNALHDIGLSYLSAGDASRARDAFDEALRLRRAIGASTLEGETLARRAEASRRLGHLQAAATDLEAAVAIVERTRGSVFERELRTSYSGAIDRYYRAYIAVLMDLHSASPAAGFDAAAFQIADRAKARGLIERLRESSVTATNRVDPALLARERQLRGLLDYWAWQAWDQADEPATAAAQVAARSRLDTLSAEHGHVEAEILRAEPAYAAMWQPKQLTLTDVQRELLSADTALLTYALGPDRSYVWAVTTDGLTVAELPGRAVIEGPARRLANALASANSSALRARQLRAATAELSRLLLLPVAGRLDRKHLLIVADGALHDVPFALLPLPTAQGSIVDAIDVVATPAVSVLRWLAATSAAAPPPTKLLAAFGDPVFDAGDPRVTSAPGRAAPGAMERRVSRLPFSRDEATRIARLAPTPQRLLALDFTASRALAMSRELEQYRYVHFATHAIRDDQRPQLSGLILSLVGPRGGRRNGFVRLQDVFDLRLRADLVVLSACETGTGQSKTGDGLTSLAHGFFNAGAARVLASLWRVDDEATAAMMEMFYARLLVGVSPAGALRAAQLEMRRRPRWADPYYWSGWVLQGLG